MGQSQTKQTEQTEAEHINTELRADLKVVISRNLGQCEMPDKPFFFSVFFESNDSQYYKDVMDVLIKHKRDFHEVKLPSPRYMKGRRIEYYISTDTEY